MINVKNVSITLHTHSHLQFINQSGPITLYCSNGVISSNLIVKISKGNQSDMFELPVLIYTEVITCVIEECHSMRQFMNDINTLLVISIHIDRIVILHSKTSEDIDCLFVNICTDKFHFTSLVSMSDIQ